MIAFHVDEARDVTISVERVYFDADVAKQMNATHFEFIRVRGSMDGITPFDVKLYVANGLPPPAVIDRRGEPT